VLTHLDAPPRIEADDATIRDAIGDAAVAALLPAVAQATGDHSVLRDHLRPDPAQVLDPDGGLSASKLAEAREVAFEALTRFRDAGCPAPAPPSDAELRRLMAFVVGDDNVGEYFDLLEEELAPQGRDLRAPGWHKDDLAADRTFRAAIVGAGMSGLLAAHRLQQAGIAFVVLEKNDDVGGTWFENTYPGCRVDVPNHLYSYSFAQGVWPQHFSSQDVLLDYFRECADAFEVRDHIRFGTEVLSATFSEERCTWSVRVRDRHGIEEMIEVEALFSAVGQLNRPHYPEIEGLADFAGPAFHSARWDHEVDLTGKRVAVIGTGASAAQFIPPVAEQAGELFVFQRTPNWLVPTPDYHDDLSEGQRWLLDHLPTYGQWNRLWLFWRTHEGLLPAAVVDPDWDGGDQSVSAPNELVRQLLAGYLQMEFADAPDLVDKVVPTYPPIAKRVIRDNGIWARTLKRDDVELVTDRIERVTARAVVTADGQERQVDVIIYGTGFHASKFLTPMQVTGRGGADLHETWGGDARAYLGITVPGFPNLFTLYGPNTNIVINGSIIYFSELEVRYVLDLLRHLLETGGRAVDVRPEVHDAFNEQVDETNRRMAWGASSVNSWYKNQFGRVAQNWPFSLLEYWQRTRRAEPSDYEVLR
jgi:4-hydroxyacetophenone monooxygenase